MKLQDAELVGVQITVMRQGGYYRVYTPYDMLLVTEEELARFAMTILMETGVAPVSKKWSEPE